ncbi:MarR family winged helix-turn-helix transcriptional regulator [Georgenia alba]|uniref:MarR family winged helix-turn-helix transcriptional regulator n=1 Tax=Georgenia alba TaxID=2233858 RepID=A0ABW2Q8I1_9MICO
MADLERDPRGSPAPARLNYTANRLARAFNRAAENTALANGVTLAQLLMIQVLGEGVPLSNAQLARRTFVSSQAAHIVLTELIAQGLVEYRDHPTNRRVRLARLTEAGWAVLDRCTQELVAVEDELQRRLGTAPGDSLTEILTHTADVLAGGYFGDAEAEAAAVARRRRPARGRPARRS